MEFFLFMLAMAGLALLLAAVHKRNKSRQTLGGRDAFKLATRKNLAPDKIDLSDNTQDALFLALSAAIESQIAAIRVLFELSRSDGTSTTAEKNIVFSFIMRQRPEINERHREHLTLALWDLPPLNDEWFDKLVIELSRFPINYRLDVVASAEAIVAVGGKAKKRETQLLARIRELTHLSDDGKEAVV